MIRRARARHSKRKAPVDGLPLAYSAVGVDAFELRHPAGVHTADGSLPVPGRPWLRETISFEFRA
jgi:hypothetical protein